MSQSLGDFFGGSCRIDLDNWEVESTWSTEIASDGACSPRDPDTGDEFEAPEAFHRDETLVIFDWDDTIFPTSWFWGQGQGLHLKPSSISENDRGELAVLGQLAKEALEIAQTKGTVVIVTNAEAGWIQMSCEKFLPSLLGSLTNVKIVSARSTYEPLGITKPSEWKYHAFKSEIDSFCKLRNRTNIVSIGDSEHERDALFRATTCKSHCSSKSVKFIDRPTLGQLSRQHKAFRGEFCEVVAQYGDVDQSFPPIIAL